MERVLIISYIISMILTAGFIYCIYREKYWVFEFVNRRAGSTSRRTVLPKTAAAFFISCGIEA